MPLIQDYGGLVQKKNITILTGFHSGMQLRFHGELDISVPHTKRLKNEEH